MGQYYKVVNITKKQYLCPHAFGDGLKLLEFGASGSSTMLGLAVLLADGNDRGGGDLHPGPSGDPDKLIGSWAGDQIVVAGDYADPGNFLDDSVIVAHRMRNPGKELTLYAHAEEFKDISIPVLKVLGCDEDIKKSLIEGMTYHPEALKALGWTAEPPPAKTRRKKGGK